MFKEVNDTYGHSIGDLVLREIAGLTLSRCRQEDALIRYGGEEFLIILFHTSKEGAVTFSERLRIQVENHKFIEDQEPIRIMLSAGIATHPEDESTTDVESMIEVADRRLYAAKNGGRNLVISEG